MVMMCHIARHRKRLFLLEMQHIVTFLGRSYVGDVKWFQHLDQVCEPR